MPSFKNLCTPAQLYLVLSAIFVIIACIKQCNFFSIIVKIIFIILWTILLNWLCSKGLTTISWILVLLPYIFFAATLLFTLELVYSMAHSHGNRREGFLEGAFSKRLISKGTNVKAPGVSTR